MIEKKGANNLHWRYFIALEEDLLRISKYIELSSENNWVYSIELAKLLLMSSSEIDVVLKIVCRLLDASFKLERQNIDNYRRVIMQYQPEICTESVIIKGYGLKLTPWQHWANEKNPEWWSGYNNVKHNRSNFFQDANLNYVLNALSGLLILLNILFEGNYQFAKPRPKLLALEWEYFQGVFEE